MAFLDDDFLLSTSEGRRLWNEAAKGQPIVDFHCHLSPRDIAEDRHFADLHAAWLEGDHYKWRAMRANGIAEDLVTGSASPKDKFRAWAATVPATLRNPLFHWTHLELRRHFGIEDLLEPDTADRVWDEASRQLASGDLTARGILRRMKVELVGTTDDPADSLEWHAALAKSGFATRVIPTFRPDAALRVRQPAQLAAWAKRLSEAAGTGADTLAGLARALAKRHDDFAAAGARASDHGLEAMPDAEPDEALAKSAWEGALKGRPATSEESAAFAAWLMRLVGRMNHAKGWVTQLHLGPVRDPNPRLAARLGADAGCDTLGDARQGPGLVRWLSALEAEGCLGRVILYNINPSDNALFAGLCGSFQDGVIPGKIQHGSAWWFLDQERGMRDQLNQLSDLGLLSRFVGMVTDSRSFLSYPRHEYFRRILCDLVGSDVATGRLPDRREWTDALVRDVCGNNARRFLGLA
jgi:glucuronate isomerase